MMRQSPELPSRVRDHGLPLVVAAVVALAGCASSPHPGTDAGTALLAPTTVAGTTVVPVVGEAGAEERIRYYSARIAETPTLYPMYTQLGVALLDRARETHDPALLARARQAEATSLAMQPNFEALMAMAGIQNYSHRFEDAISWAHRASAASVGGELQKDPAVIAALVEAWLGLGHLEEAKALVPASLADAADFHSAASLARWLSASARHDEAAEAYLAASRLALRDDVTSLAAWAEAAAAGELLDAGRVADATVHLDAAGRLGPASSFLEIHRAEAAHAAGRDRDALRILETVLERDPDPAIEAMAFVAARRSADGAAADRHFRAAESGFERAITAGEVYSLGALAQLFVDADVQPERALRLARENLHWKRDRAAVATLDAAEGAVRAKRRARNTARP